MSVAAETLVAPARRVRLARWVPAARWALAGLLVVATAEIVVDASVGHSPLVPKSPTIAGWMSAIGERLGYGVFLLALLIFTAAYAALLLLVRRADALLDKRFAIVVLGVLHLVIFLGPILISTDVFSYIAYSRMGVVHGINPYLNGPVAISRDAIFKYVGHDWRRTATAYGPFYTLLSYPFAPLGVTGAVWGMKVLAQAASVGTLILTWRCAKAREVNPVWAILLVGANPLYLLYGLGGAHNDMVMLCLMMAGVSLTFARRDAAASAVIVAGTLVKATVGVLFPFMLLARRRLSSILGALAVLALGAVVAYAAFGVHGMDVISALNRDAAFVSSDSFATEIAHLFGKPGIFPVDHAILKGGLVVIVLHLIWRTWRGYDWVAASGWTLLAISVTSSWLLAWYLLWPMPLAVVARDRRLLAATFMVQALFMIHQTSPGLVSVE